jgi:hypothetical protein
MYNQVRRCLVELAGIFRSRAGTFASAGQGFSVNDEHLITRLCIRRGALSSHRHFLFLFGTPLSYKYIRASHLAGFSISNRPHTLLSAAKETTEVSKLRAQNFQAAVMRIGFQELKSPGPCPTQNFRPAVMRIGFQHFKSLRRCPERPLNFESWKILMSSRFPHFIR